MNVLQNIAVNMGELVRSAFLLVVTSMLDNFSEIVDALSREGLESLSILFPIAVLILQINVLIIMFKVLRLLWYLLHEVRLPWQQSKSYSVSRGGRKRILVVGDSTAYGTGAERPEDTIAGRLGHDFPKADILNTSVSGSLTGNVIDQLSRAGDTQFDLIIISTGGNDIWHMTRLKKLERDLRLLLDEAKKKSTDKVILLFYANFGEAPLFPPIIHSILSRRTDKIHALFARVAAELDVPLVELYTKQSRGDHTNNPFIENPKKYYARDKMHPNSEGYRLWYNRMWLEMVKRNLTFED